MRFIILFNICLFIITVGFSVTVNLLTDTPVMTSLGNLYTEFWAGGWIGYAVFAIIATFIAGSVKIFGAD